MRYGSTLKRWALGGCAFAVLSGEPAWAQQPGLVRFDIPRSALDWALRQFAVQSGREVIFAPDLVRGRVAPEVRGELSTEEGLRRLLAGSGLDYRSAGERTFVVQRAPAPPARKPSSAPAPAPKPVREPGQPPHLLPADVEEVVVTGTSIRGVAPPVGSNLVAVDRETMEKIAATNVTEVVNTLPAITTSFAAPQGPNAYSSYAPSIHGIAGSGANTTLTIVDGLRMPGGGTQYAQPDPNIIPVTALQRVEVLAEGASSVYGSDAVAGVVNFITRRIFDGANLNARAGLGDEYRSYDASAIIGRVWDTGGAYVAAQFTKQDALQNTSRPFISRGDYRDIGGSNTNSFTCLPATIRTDATGGDLIYPSPTATAPIVNNVSANGFCNTSTYGTAIPAQQRENILVNLYQELGGRASILTKVNFNHVNTSRAAMPGSGSVTVFGPGSAAARAAQVNPFFQAPAGEPSASEEVVSYLALRPDGDYGHEHQENDTFYTTSVVEYALTQTWRAKLSGALGRSDSSRAFYDVFCAPCATLALNGTSQAGGAATTPLASSDDIVITQLPLTTANALDVWRPPETSRTSAEVLERIYANDEELRHFNTFEQVRAELQGPLFVLPAGDVKVAAGGEYMWMKQKIRDLNGGAVTSTGIASQFTAFDLQRSVYSGFLEFYVPLVSEAMEVPFVRSFELSLSARYDRYSDFGGTTNPKIAANWEVRPGVRLRGNYAEAFVAPPLAQVGDPARGFARTANGATLSTPIEVPLALYPEVRGVPGCATAEVTCRIGVAANPGLNRQLGSGLAGTRPQLGESWSVGLDVTNEAVRNLTANLTYWSTTFIGGTATPAVELVMYSGALHDRLTICPSGCTPQQVRAYTNVDNGAPFNVILPPAVYFLMDRSLRNDLNLDVQGIDAQFKYRIPAGAAGAFTVGASLTYFTKYDQWFLTDPRFSVLDTSGYNSQFPSIQTKARGHFGWAWEAFSADLFVNYTGAYRNWLQSSVEPIVLDRNRNPVGGGDRVKANVTFDLNAAYRFSRGFLRNAQVYLDVKNLFDRAPPFYNGNTSGIGVGGWGFNGFVSNPLGRIVSVGLRATI